MQVWYGTYETTLDVQNLSEEQSSSKCKDRNWISAVCKHIRYPDPCAWWQPLQIPTFPWTHWSILCRSVYRWIKHYCWIIIIVTYLISSPCCAIANNTNWRQWTWAIDWLAWYETRRVINNIKMPSLTWVGIQCCTQVVNHTLNSFWEPGIS